MIQIKMCGIQRTETAEAMTEMDIQYAGIIFAPSRRQVSIQKAKPIVSALRKTDLNITGVFRNQPIQTIDQAVNELQLDVVQLHGDETAEDCHALKQKHEIHVVKVVSLEGAPQAEDVIQRMNPYKDVVDILMLDTHDPQYGGGAGKIFRWEIIPEIRKWVHEHGLKLFIAGGLNAQNVHRLIDLYQPDGVDVSSGIETDGHKDIHKMKLFIERVRNS